MAGVYRAPVSFPSGSAVGQVPYVSQGTTLGLDSAFTWDETTNTLTVGAAAGAALLKLLGVGGGSSFGDPVNLIIESSDASCWALTFRRADQLPATDVSLYNAEGTLSIGGDAATFHVNVIEGAYGITEVAVADLPVAPEIGYEANVSDSSVDTWGDAVADGGALHVKVRWNGSDWTVVGK